MLQLHMETGLALERDAEQKGLDVDHRHRLLLAFTV